MAELSEAYVVGLLAEVEPLVSELGAALAEARWRSARIDTELTVLLGRLDGSRASLAAQLSAAEQEAALLAASNSRLATLHQEVAAVTRRAADFKTEMDRVGPGVAHNRLRRERARLLVQIEDREKEVTALKAAIDKARAVLAEAEMGAQEERDRGRALSSDLDRLQSELPSPHLYLRLFEALAARAHCRLYLDQSRSAWAEALGAAIVYVRELHQELRAGKYRLDKNSDVLGGRTTASAEAVFGAVVLGDIALARDLFGHIADPGLLLDHIFNVFRIWCLGLYLEGDARALARLAGRHRWAQGLRGGYAEAFLGLVERQPARVSASLKTIAREEWRLWQDPGRVRGVGVVSLGATAIARLAGEAGLRVTLPGPSVPGLLLQRARPQVATRR
jgi:hypothetical protein